MALLQRGLLVLATAGALAIPAYLPDQGISTAPRSQDRTVVKGDGPAYAASSIEYYLDATTQAWIRPGLNVTIGAVTNFAPGQKPTVALTITDDLKRDSTSRAGRRRASSRSASCRPRGTRRTGRTGT